MHKAKTREELLTDLVDILGAGYESHTDAVNGLGDLLFEEAEAEPDAEWVKKLRALEPR